MEEPEERPARLEKEMGSNGSKEPKSKDDIKKILSQKPKDILPESWPRGPFLRWCIGSTTNAEMILKFVITLVLYVALGLVIGWVIEQILELVLSVNNSTLSTFWDWLKGMLIFLVYSAFLCAWLIIPMLSFAKAIEREEARRKAKEKRESKGNAAPANEKKDGKRKGSEELI